MNIDIFVSHNDRNCKSKQNQYFGQVNPFNDLEVFHRQCNESDHDVDCDIQNEPKKLLDRKLHFNRDTLVYVNEGKECKHGCKDHVYGLVFEMDLPAKLVLAFTLLEIEKQSGSQY